MIIMVKQIEKKIEELGREIASLSDAREAINSQLKEINTRLVQLTGAISEIQKLKKEIEGEKSD